MRISGNSVHFMFVIDHPVNLGAPTLGERGEGPQEGRCPPASQALVNHPKD